MKKKNIEKYDSQVNQIYNSSVPIISHDSNKSKIKRITGHIFDSMTLTIASGIITSLVCCFVYTFMSFMSNMSEMQNNIESLNDKINGYSETQDQIERLLDDVIIQSASLNRATSENNEKVISAYDSFLEIINRTYSSEQTILDTMGQNLWEDSSLVIGRDTENGVEYTINELTKESIVTAYIDKSTGETVVFKGQYDKYNHWDGNCIINRYKDNKLVFIMDAIYISGELTKYKQAFPYTNTSGVDLWLVSERTVEEYKNRGETWSYFKDSEYEKIIEVDSIKSSDVIDADSFRLMLSSKLEGYYNGYTSNGLYNDNTGQAYLVKYAREGYIRTLYVGKIENGYFEDESNNAWYIVKSEDTDYMYYKGMFHNGSPVGNDESTFKNSISNEEIEKILQDNNFNTDLCWYEESE